MTVRPARSIALAALAALVACSEHNQNSASAGDPNLFAVQTSDLPITVKENAELQALHETIVRSEVEGQATIIYIIPEGTNVKKGDKLIELDVSDLVEKRAAQAIAVEKARAAWIQSKKEREILDKTISAAENTAESNLLIAQLELEKCLGRKNGPSESKNRDMVRKLKDLVSKEPEKVVVADATLERGKATPVLLAQVDPRSYARLVDKVTNDLLYIESQKESALDYDLGDMASKILNQADAIQLAIADLKVKEDTYAKSFHLADLTFITKNELEKDQLAYQSQMSKVTLAWNDLDLLINYTLAKDRIKLRKDVENAALELARVGGANESSITKADSDLYSKEAEKNLATERLDNFDRQIRGGVILAPTPGLVVYSKLDRGRGGEAVREGVQVRERQELIILPDTTKMRGIIKVQEAQVDKVARGQPCYVQVEAFPGETFTGRVVSVAPVADSNSGWMTSDRKVYTTVFELDGDNPDARLRSRMAAAVTIVMDTLHDVLAIPLQAVRRDRSVNYVWKKTPEGPLAATVQAGRHNAERVEIQHGVSLGDTLYLTPPAGVQEPKFEQPAVPVSAPLKVDEKSVATDAGQPGGKVPGANPGNGAGPGNGQRGGQGKGGMMNKKLAEMTPEELQQFKDGMAMFDTMLDRMRDKMTEEQVQKATASLAQVHRALDANKLDEAQAAIDSLRAAMPKMGGNRGKQGGGGNPAGDGQAPARGND
jgi:HlyD family secretion protein